MTPFSVKEKKLNSPWKKKVVFGNIIKYLLNPSDNINSADLKLQKY
jgi:hypothetical protein